MGKTARDTKTVKKPATDAAGGPGGKKESGKRSGLPRWFSGGTLIATACAAGLLVVLLFLIHWLAAISIASGLWVFADASLMRITRLTPSRKGFALATTVWGAAGFVPVVGVAAYVYLRGALARASPSDIAPASMSDERAKEAGKLRARKVSASGAAVVGALAAAVALAGWYAAGDMTLEFGTDYTRAFRIEGGNSRDRFGPGTVAVKLSSFRPIEECGNLDWELYAPGKARDRPRKSTVKPRRGAGKTVWVWKIRWQKTPGEYRLDVLGDDGTVVKRGYFTIRPKY